MPTYVCPFSCSTVPLGKARLQPLSPLRREGSPSVKSSELNPGGARFQALGREKRSSVHLPSNCPALGSSDMSAWNGTMFAVKQRHGNRAPKGMRCDLKKRVLGAQKYFLPQITEIPPIPTFGILGEQLYLSVSMCPPSLP